MVWISAFPRPETSADAFDNPHVELAPLRSTSGDQNSLLPDGLGLDDARSVVIWCVPVRIVYAAAALEPVA